MTGCEMNNYRTETAREYYNRYKFAEITLSGMLEKSSGIVNRDIFFKAGEMLRPCRMHAVSMTGAKVSADLSDEDLAFLKNSPGIRLHYSFIGLKPSFIPISFTVPYRVNYLADSGNGGANTHLMSLCAEGPPPDILAVILGELMGIQEMTSKRSELRITVTDETVKDIGLKSGHSRIILGDQSAECLLQDISASGCQLLLKTKDQVKGRKAVVELFFREPDMIFRIPGVVMRAREIRESTDTSAGIKFDADQIPDEYRARLHNISL